MTKLSQFIVSILTFSNVVFYVAANGSVGPALIPVQLSTLMNTTSPGGTISLEEYGVDQCPLGSGSRANELESAMSVIPCSLASNASEPAGYGISGNSCYYSTTSDNSTKTSTNVVSPSKAVLTSDGTTRNTILLVAAKVTLALALAFVIPYLFSLFQGTGGEIAKTEL